MGQLDSKVALVTGATSGIGRATAKRFIDEGALVFVTGRRQAELDATVTELGSNSRCVRSDVSRPDDLDELFRVIAEHGHGLDVLFANAGGGTFAALEEVTAAHFDDTFATNVRGTLFTVQKALPLLNSGASVILAGSTAATSGTPAFGVYAASKAAIRSFARTWTTELAPRGIRVNVVVPGPIDTEGLRGLAPDATAAADLVAQLGSEVPIGRAGDRMRSPPRSCSSPATRAASSPAASSSPTVVSLSGNSTSFLTSSVRHTVPPSYEPVSTHTHERNDDGHHRHDRRHGDLL